MPICIAIPRARPIKTGYPAWIACDCCEDFICTIHSKHVCDCDCAPIEHWLDGPDPIYPYADGGKPV